MQFSFQSWEKYKVRIFPANIHLLQFFHSTLPSHSHISHKGTPCIPLHTKCETKGRKSRLRKIRVFRVFLKGLSISFPITQCFSAQFTVPQNAVLLLKMSKSAYLSRVLSRSDSELNRRRQPRDVSDISNIHSIMASIFLHQ